MTISATRIDDLLKPISPVEFISNVLDNINKKEEINIDYEKRIYILNKEYFSVKIYPNGEFKILLNGNNLAKSSIEESLYFLLLLKRLTSFRFNEEDYKKIIKQILKKVRKFNEEIDKKYRDLLNNLKEKTTDKSRLISKLNDIIKALEDVLINHRVRVVVLSDKVTIVIYYKKSVLYKPLKGTGISIGIFKNTSKNIYEVDYKVYVNNQEVK
jgi:hypothetical protein